MKGYVDLEFGRSDGRHRRQRPAGRLGQPRGEPGRRQRAGGHPGLRPRPTSTRCSPRWSAAPSYLGKDADAAHFAARRRDRQGRVQRDASSTPTAGYYRGTGDRGYRQTHNVLAVAFGLTPDAATEQRVVDSIAADVRAKGVHLNTGVLGTKYLLPVLTDHGHADLAYDARGADDVPQLGLHDRQGRDLDVGALVARGPLARPLLPRHRRRLVLPRTSRASRPPRRPATATSRSPRR